MQTQKQVVSAEKFQIEVEKEMCFLVRQEYMNKEAAERQARASVSAKFQVATAN